MTSHCRVCQHGACRHDSKFSGGYTLWQHKEGIETDLAKPRSLGRTCISTVHHSLFSAPRWSSLRMQYGPLACAGKWANASASIACPAGISLTSTPGSTTENQRTLTATAVHAGLHASSAALRIWGGGLQWRTVWRQRPLQALAADSRT